MEQDWTELNDSGTSTEFSLLADSIENMAQELNMTYTELNDSEASTYHSRMADFIENMEQERSGNMASSHYGPRGPQCDPSIMERLAQEQPKSSNDEK